MKEVLNSQPRTTYRYHELSSRVSEHIEMARNCYDQHKQLSDYCSFSDQQHLHQKIDANLDGIRISEQLQWALLKEALAELDAAGIFICALFALENRHTKLLQQLIALSEKQPSLCQGILDALSWTPLSFTRPLIPAFLSKDSDFYRLMALHIINEHCLPANNSLEWALLQHSPMILSLGLNGTGNIGVTDLLSTSNKHLYSEDPTIRFQAARCTLLLGEKEKSIAVIMNMIQENHSYFIESARLLAIFLPVAEGQATLSTLARIIKDRRLLIRLAGELGDPSSIPALLRLMQDPKLARIAAFAFCFITGLDLIEHNMDVNAPEDFEAGPNDDPDDDNVESDPDEDLPWPDRNKLMQWWEQHGSSFKPGIRYLMGKEITREHCLDVLEFGNQAQRKIAALHLKKMDPASPLFLIDAPAWRQQARLQLLRNS